MGKNIKYIVIVIIIVICLISGYFVLNNYFNKEEDITFLKDYDVNEFISVYVSDEDMAKIYLNDYTHNMFFDVKKAYDSLNDKYRNTKFGSLESYEAYVNLLTYPSYTLDKYFVKNKNGYVYYGVYDKNNNLYIFETKGIMQYTVYLDDYTVEIW